METMTLEPVDSVRITSLVDNVADTTAPDTGPARRAGWGRGTLEAQTIVGGRSSVPLVAEHGFSALVDVAKGDTTHRILFDTGVSPNGMIENMRRLEVDPTTIEAIVLSHGHYDHTTGMHGLIEALGRPNLPVVQPLRVGRGRDDVVARLDLQQEARDLPDLLADDDVAGVVGVFGLVEGIEFVSGLDCRQISVRHPANGDIAARDEVLRVGAKLCSDAEKVAHD